ncbi:hypothetical protein QG044_11135, partial [Kingella kingae]|uniref:hypothetical protein n=1 Tax=Kingella kingae TaxID=504 RepID=UPI00254F758A
MACSFRQSLREYTPMPRPSNPNRHKQINRIMHTQSHTAIQHRRRPNQKSSLHTTSNENAGCFSSRTIQIRRRIDCFA